MLITPMKALSLSGLVLLTTGLHGQTTQASAVPVKAQVRHMTVIGATATAGITSRTSSGSAFNFNDSAPPEQSLHLVVGRSIFVNTKHRLTRVYITNPAVLDSYTASPNQIVVTAKTTGSSTLIIWDESGESKAYLISSDINVDALRDSMKQALPNDNVQVQGSEGRVVLSGMVGTDGIADSAVKLASLYSKEVSNSIVVNPAQVKQVRLKVRIIEVDRSKLNQFGFNFSMAAASSSKGGGAAGGDKNINVSNPLNFSFYNSKLNISATLADLETKQVLQILAEPTITTMSGQKANFLAGGEFPFPVVQGGSSGLASVTIQFRPYGVKLEFLPVVNTDGTVALKVAPEVSALDYTNSVTISGYTIPALSTRRAETQMVLRSGQSFAISGLLDKRTTDSLGRTPGISNVPILGQLFKTKNINHATTELIVIVTPTIVDPLTESIVAEEPVPVIPTLDAKSFDQSLPKPKVKK